MATTANANDIVQGIDSFLDELREKCAVRSIRDVLENVRGLRMKTNRMQIETCLREMMNVIATNGNGGGTGSSASRSISRLRAHRAALGGIIGRLLGKTTNSRAQQEAVIGRFLGNINDISVLIDKVPLKCPPWFTELPILFLFVIISFVVCSEIQWRVTLGKDFSEEKLDEYLKNQDSSYFLNFNKSFKKGMLKAYRTLHYICMTNWEYGVPNDSGGNILSEATNRFFCFPLNSSQA